MWSIQRQNINILISDVSLLEPYAVNLLNVSLDFGNIKSYVWCRDKREP